MLREVSSGCLRLTKAELRLLRERAARNGYAPGPTPRTRQEVLALLIDGLPDEVLLQLADEIECRKVMESCAE